jgi:cytochrome b pre-mRNA-processing protein 3
MLRRFLEPDASSVAATSLYQMLVARARAPVFHTKFAVPDTIDGRFDLLALHASVLMEALKLSGTEGAKLGSALASVIFAGFDGALRELGVGDLGISRRMKAMAGAFYGRLQVYGAADSQAALAAAILRNLYRGEESRGDEAQVLAHYIAKARQTQMTQPRALLQGVCDFGPLPEFEVTS